MHGNDLRENLSWEESLVGFSAYQTLLKRAKTSRNPKEDRMRLDHIAYRVKDRWKTANFLIEALGYHVQQEFTIDFGEGQTAQCIALEPPEKTTTGLPWTQPYLLPTTSTMYHMPPEIFVSDGSPGSIVGNWVDGRGGIGGIHHIAYQVESVEETMKLWKEKGYAEFTSEQPMKCPGLTQVFTKPSELTGVIFEFIEREEHGFCRDNVKELMRSTSNL
jgi:4-hydroxyphenylpyruvate dioxygenase-like putative hemolysin